jgi:hypothetical protein
MTTFPSTRYVAVLAAVGLLSGCAGTGPLLPSRTTLGSLKTSVSHLEYENDQLRSQVAKLESEKRDVEDRLVQEEWANGDLSKRLDDARQVLSQRGLDDSLLSGGSRADSGGADSARTLPAGQSNRKRRKAPFAQIPGRIENAPSSEPVDDSFVNPKQPIGDGLGPQGSLDSERWLPIAQGTSDSTKNQRR